MPVFYKFSNDGKNVYIAKTMFSKNIMEAEYFEKAKKISVEDFLSKFDEKVKAKLQEEINYLSELNGSIIKVGKKANNQSIDKSIILSVNDKVFHHKHFLKNEESSAGKYVQETYGKEFYDEWYKNFVIEQREEKESIYMKTKDGIKQLNSNQIIQIENIIKNLTKIKSLDNLLVENIGAKKRF